MKNSHIQWTDHTFNPWEGCTMVSPGCANCYALTRNKRFAGGKNWGKGAPRRRTSPANWVQPLKWNRDVWAECPKCGVKQPHGDVCIVPDCFTLGQEMQRLRPRVFCASLADWLDDEVPIEWLADLLKLIRGTPNLDWLLLTKRPQNWSKRLHDAFRADPTEKIDWVSGWLDGDEPANVWIGASVENQEMADKRIPLLLSIPAKVRFLSAEPLLGPLNLRGRPSSNICICCGEGPNALHAHKDGYRTRGLDWVIVGGESGPGAREFDLDWARSLVEQCRTAGVACFVKQLGENPVEQINGVRPTSLGLIHDKKGGDMAEWPADLHVRQFPKVEVLA